MGILEKAKGLVTKAQEVVEEHSDQVKAGIDKAEGLANKATKGKFTDKIEAIGDKAAGIVPTKHSADDAAATQAEPAAPAAAPPAAEPVAPSAADAEPDAQS